MQVRVIVITPLIPVYFRHVITPFLDVSSGNEQLVQLKNWVVARKGLVDSHFENQHFFLGGGRGSICECFQGRNSKRMEKFCS